MTTSQEPDEDLADPMTAEELAASFTALCVPCEDEAESGGRVEEGRA